MQLDTKYFGRIDYAEEDVLEFPNGLFGFEDQKKFLLLPFSGSNGNMLCLQSVAGPSPAFIPEKCNAKVILPAIGHTKAGTCTTGPRQSFILSEEKGEWKDRVPQEPTPTRQQEARALCRPRSG